MKKLWLLALIILSGSSWLQSQRAVALLNTPVRPITGEYVVVENQKSTSFQVDRGMIYLEAILEGVSGSYILDTGAPSLIINEVPQQKNEAYIAQSCSNEVQVGLRPVSTFEWVGKRMKNFEALTLDLSHLELAHQAPVSGLIGYELFQNQTLFLDYQRGQLLLMKGGMPTTLDSPIARIPFELDDHLPVIELTIDGRVVRLGIDTGASANLLNTHWIAALGSNLSYLAQEEIQGLDQDVKRVEVIQIENLTHQNFQASGKFLLLDISHLSSADGPTLDGLLGHQFLSNYKVAIDYQNHELLLWPNASEQ